ncbi:hypothetical protein CPC08DRAFT_225678 [Agrocybe pediades]|nr:hypothetical protein CPC08DRAFT_225678 [Agrocybe pediades]
MSKHTTFYIQSFRKLYTGRGTSLLTNEDTEPKRQMRQMRGEERIGKYKHRNKSKSYKNEDWQTEGNVHKVIQQTDSKREIYTSPSTRTWEEGRGTRELKRNAKSKTEYVQMYGDVVG